MTDRTCAVDGCASEARVRGWCSKHYTRWQRRGNPELAVFEKTHSVTECEAPECGRPGPFVRGFCRKHYSSLKRHGDALAARTTQSRSGTCDVVGCGSAIKANRLCAMHVYRQAMHGGADLPPASNRAVNSGGYVVIKVDPSHPMAWTKGWAYQHRVVLFDAIGPGQHPCHWCRAAVAWEEGSLTVDHLDWDTANNDPGNLVAACLPCNSARLRRAAS